MQTAIEGARTIGIAITVAVVDRGGHLIGQLWMDGCKLPSTHVAMCKAWTSAMLERSSGDYATGMAPGGGAYALFNAFPGRMIPVGGGKPVMHEGVCIGGIGVSGGSSEQDDELAAAAVAAIVGKAKQ
jgi:uncharacterized protein GlcG (DUF336 family)